MGKLIKHPIMLKFRKLTAYKEGLIFSLLNRSYEGLLREIPALAEKWQQDWKQYDKEIIQFPKTIGASGFVTIYNKIIIGFGSYDFSQRQNTPENVGANGELLIDRFKK